MAMAVDNGWVMPTPPAPPRWPWATAMLIAGAVVGAVLEGAFLR